MLIIALCFLTSCAGKIPPSIVPEETLILPATVTSSVYTTTTPLHTPIVNTAISIAQPTDAAIQLTSISPCAIHSLNSADAPSVDLVTTEDQRLNALVINQGNVSLSSLQMLLEQANALRILPDGSWLLQRNLIIKKGAQLTIDGKAFPRLLLKSDSSGFIWIKALGGGLVIDDACISSWDAGLQTVDSKYEDGRSFILARDGARMDIHRSDISYLGYMADESYGLAWRLEGSSGELFDSRISYNFYGMYTYAVSNMHIRGNEVHHNVRYGIDPHTRSNHMLIENNIAHDNGKQGIILAEGCTDAIIRNNIVYANGIHGIVVYQQSNRAIVEGNQSYDNASQGINVNDSQDVIVRNNHVYGNHEDGIGIGQQARNNIITGNTVLANAHDGITLYSDASNNTIQANDVRENGRYGIYVKSPGNQVLDNTVTGNIKGDILEP